MKSVWQGSVEFLSRNRYVLNVSLALEGDRKITFCPYRSRPKSQTLNHMDLEDLHLFHILLNVI